MWFNNLYKFKMPQYRVQSYLYKLIFSHAVTAIENPMKIKVARKFVARIKTEIHHKNK